MRAAASTAEARPPIVAAAASSRCAVTIAAPAAAFAARVCALAVADNNVSASAGATFRAYNRKEGSSNSTFAVPAS